MSDNHRTARASFSGPEDFIEQAKEYAEDRGLSFSRLVRLSLEHTMEIDGVEVESGYWELREDIKDRNRFAQNKAFFLDRVNERLTELFTSRAKPKEIIDVARGYVEEAEGIEAESQERDDVTDYASGELVREVKHLVRETLEAQNLTNWDKRYTNRLERFEGVEDGVRRKKFALVLTQNAMRKDLDLEPLRSLANSERRVRADDLPDLADNELPQEIDREQVARIARRLVDDDVQPDDLPTDPFEFIEQFGGGSFGWNIVEDSDQALEPGADPDPNAGAVIAADGGDLDTRELPESEHDHAQADGADQLDDDHDDEQPGARREADSLDDVIEWSSTKLRDARIGDDPAFTDQKNKYRKKQARQSAEKQIRTRLENDDVYMEIMDDHNLTPDDVIELADDYNERIDEALSNGQADPVDPVPEDFQNGGVEA